MTSSNSKSFHNDKEGKMSGFSSFLSSVSSKAKQMAQDASESVKPLAEKVKAQAASIDTVPIPLQPT